MNLEDFKAFRRANRIKECKTLEKNFPFFAVIGWRMPHTSNSKFRKAFIEWFQQTFEGEFGFANLLTTLSRSEVPNRPWISSTVFGLAIGAHQALDEGDLFLIRCIIDKFHGSMDLRIPKYPDFPE